MELCRVSTWDGTPVRVSVVDGCERDGAMLNAFAQSWRTTAIAVAPGCWAVNRLARKAMTTEMLVSLATDMFECNRDQIEITEQRERGGTFTMFTKKE